MEFGTVAADEVDVDAQGALETLARECQCCLAVLLILDCLVGVGVDNILGTPLADSGEESNVLSGEVSKSGELLQRLGVLGQGML